MAKRIIRLTESDIKRMVRQTIKEAYDQFSDEDFASDGDPYGLTTNKEPVGDFKVEDITVNGDMDVSQEFFSIYGQNFDSKYDFAAALNDYMQENFGTTVTDVDLASEFGDEGNEICINTDNRMPITAHGGYTDMYESRIRKAVSESVRRTLNEEMRLPGKDRSGYTPNDGNPMVGGKWGAFERYFTVDVTDKLYEEVESTFEGESEEICDYISRNEELFKLKGIISCSYDESVGLTMSMPDYEIEDIDTEEAEQCLSEYPDANVAQQLVQIFNTIVDNINADEVEMIEQD